MKRITLEIEDSKFEELVRFLYYKMLMVDLDPENDPLDWLALELGKGAIEAAKATSDDDRPT